MRRSDPVVRLTRACRVNLVTGGGACGAAVNRWAGEPPTYDFVPRATLALTLEGAPDPQTGYVADIRRVDAVLRGVARAACAGAGQGPPGGSALPSPARLLESAWEAALRAGFAAAPLRVSVACSPQLCWALSRETMPLVELTQSFEFSAAHRLHAPQLSEDENRRVFGKCNNPGGHGHNYVVDVTVVGEPDPRSGLLLPVGRIEELVQREVLERFDHRHLNQDCPEFRGLNPSVENIARVIFGLLDGAVAPARLSAVRVWETPKTWAEARA